MNQQPTFELNQGLNYFAAKLQAPLTQLLAYNKPGALFIVSTSI